MKNVKIPDYLKDADSPYATTQSSSCADMQAELAQLTEFLGPDWDSEAHYSKVGGKRGNLFDAILPYGGLVRFVSGASKHEKKVLQTADYASVRRAHLKTIAQIENANQRVGVNVYSDELQHRHLSCSLKARIIACVTIDLCLSR